MLTVLRTLRSAAQSTQFGCWSSFLAIRANSTSSQSPGVTVTVKDGVRTVLMDRADKFNAITTEMFEGMSRALSEANSDDATNVVVLTGRGKFFSSGNDLSNLKNIRNDAEYASSMLRTFVGSFIECKKPLMALVNGPAVGISVTVLGLCDAVYCSDSATFHAPFTLLGTSPEGCSSYTFPRIMGYSKASELLFFNRKITAAQAYDWGLVSQVFLTHRFEQEAWQAVQQVADLPVKSLIYSKDLVRGRERETLHKANAAECERLVERWRSADCANAVQKILAGRPKKAQAAAL